jgi:hypothetical protein
MRTYSSAIALALLLAGLAAADIPFQKQAVREAIVPHGQFEGARGTCSVVYYNICSGWIWVWSPFTGRDAREADQIGVVFDLPEDCNMEPGSECLNLGFWWYWRYTVPGWGYTLSYHLWNADENNCKIGPAVGALLRQDPVERWNYYPGLGWTASDYVAITATMDRGALPYWVTDNNWKNAAAPIRCEGWPGPIEKHSFIFGEGYEGTICPTYYLGDGMGPVQFLMDASFESQGIAIEPASWGTIKSLFR